MKDQLLFDIEPIEKQEIPDKRRPFTVGRKKANRASSKRSSPLMEAMSVEIAKVSLLICKQPKTYRLVPCNWTEKQKAIYIASHCDENGRLICNPPSDFEIFSGMSTRQ